MNAKSLAAQFDPDARVSHFLNVDLELAGAFDITVLTSALSSKLFELYAGRDGRLHHAYYEVSGLAPTTSKTILALAKVINRLSPAAMRQWRRLRIRRFNIGIQAGLEPNFHEAIVSPQAVAAIAALRGEIVVTTYAPVRRKR